MPTRKSSVIWEGNLRDGRGTMDVGGGKWKGEYTFMSRFEEGKGTNPEELIGAAHAGCFSMALSGQLAKAGFKPERVASTATVHLDKVGEGFRITRIELATEVKAAGLEDEQKLAGIAEDAKNGCPVSQALKGV